MIEEERKLCMYEHLYGTGMVASSSVQYNNVFLSLSLWHDSLTEMDML